MKVKIISLVRDLIARNISDFFHDFEDWAGKPPEQIHGGLQGIKKIFLERFDHDYTLRWFDQWRETLGVNVYNYPFPSSGCKKISSKTVDIFVIRIEKEDEKKRNELSNFLDFEELNLTRRNMGSKKKHGGVYEKFKNKIKMPEKYIDRMYKSNFFNHFYTQAHREEFSSRWT